MKATIMKRNIITTLLLCLLACVAKAQPTAGKTYYISCSGGVLQVADGNTNTSVTVGTKTTGNSYQQWKVQDGSTTGTIKLVNVGSSLAMDMAANSRTNCGSTLGKTPLQWTVEDNNYNQDFYYTSAGYLYIYNDVCADYTGNYYLVASGTATKQSMTESDATVFTFEEVGGSTTDPTTDTDHGSFSASWIADQNTNGKYLETAHATYIPYATTADMTADANYDKPWLTPEKAEYLSLNGTWKFKFLESTTSTPNSTWTSGAYYANSVSTDGWDDITVPLSWEMANYSEPVYTNVGYPFKNQAPNANQGLTEYGVDGHNHVGFYRRTFTLPDGWTEKRVFLHFDGVYSAAAVYVNGKFVGYTENANTDSDFDLTGFVAEGENNVSVAVYRWSDGSYLEGQDMWHLSGIHRDVYLCATPKVFVSDHYITSSLGSDATSGTMSVALTLDNRDGGTVNKTVKVQLIDAAGSVKGTQTATFSTSGTSATQTVTFSGLMGLTPWSAENPYLYTVSVSQMDADGNEEMAFSTKYGFRNITKSGNLIYINGQRVYFKGVNTQDTHMLKGRAIDVETMLTDITMMKRANVNTVRTSHYPRQPKMYAMFDYYGLYVMDEADVECHYNQSLTSNSSWQTVFVQRNTDMVRRDRNHPSVIFWSTGNECGTGSNLQAAYTAIKAIDSRLVHYEAGSSSSGYSDLGASMYPTIAVVKERTSGYSSKPYFMCEYAHSMGQATGNLQEYWDVIEGSTGIIGGCIWDWVDQAIISPAKIASGELTQSGTGFNYLTAGYDYQSASYVNYGFQGNFMDNGLITADRQWTAKLTEVKNVYKYVEFSSLSGKTLTLKNKYNFTNLSSYALVWTVLKDGRIVEQGQCAVPSVAPGNSGTVNIPYTTTVGSDAEYLLNVQLCLSASEAWAPEGYAVAEGQFTLQERGSLQTYNCDSKVTLSGNTVSGTTAQGKAFSIAFNSSTGAISSWTVDGKSVLYSSPVYNNFRRIDNNRGDVSSYLTTSTQTSVQSALKQSGNAATITVKNSYSKCGATMVYTIYGDGTVDLKATFTPSDKQYRIGLGMQFPSGFEDVEFYAKGPWSNYADRQTGSWLGRYTTTVDDMFEEISHPQTMGDHYGLRDLTLTNRASGVALNIQTDGDVSFSLSHYDEQQWNHGNNGMYSTVLHPYSLTRSSQVYAHFDRFQRGLGNGSCGGDDCLSDYECPTSGSYSYTLRFTPLTME